MAITVRQIANFISSPLDAIFNPDTHICYVSVDSRQLFVPRTTLFVALKGKYVDGHDFIPLLYQQGVRNFIVTQQGWKEKINASDANFFLVPNALSALQKIATAYRETLLQTEVVGIVGSVGKTIVKEWLFDSLSPTENIYQSPRSYNSQLGVPLSVMGIKQEHRIALIEAGISKPREMDVLTKIAQPKFGVLSAIDTTHNENFSSHQEKIKEKINFLLGCSHVICSHHNEAFATLRDTYKGQLVYWSREDKTANVYVENIHRHIHSSQLALYIDGKAYTLKIPFLEQMDIENSLLCLTTLLTLGYEPEFAFACMERLTPVVTHWTRTELHYNNYLIDDIRHTDLHSLSIGLSKLSEQSRYQKFTIFLSDLWLDQEAKDEEIYTAIANRLQTFENLRLVLVGERIASRLFPLLQNTHIECVAYDHTEALLADFHRFALVDEAILVLAQQKFNFQQIVSRLIETSHSTRFRINLTQFKENINIYKSFLAKHVKVMGMVKAFGYGSGAVEMAQQLQRMDIDYLGIAYADEGVELRKANIRMPMMVMNMELESIEKIVDYRLEPVLYSRWLMDGVLEYCKKNNIYDYPVHLEVDTGMHRLGIEENEIDEVIDILSSSPHVRLQSIFSHFCSSDNPTDDAFTQQQFATLQRIVAKAKQKINTPFLAHIANTSAVARFPAYHWDMVRLGIGMYGFDASFPKIAAKPIVSLMTTIAQIKHLRAGDRIGYGDTIVTRPTTTATIRIGYADGFSRILSYGKGFVYIKNKKAPVLGKVCMDMTMVDITDIADVQLGDEVEIFGNRVSFLDFCRELKKSPYEVLSTFSSRLKREYIEE